MFQLSKTILILSSMQKSIWKKFKSEFHVFGWFSGLQNLDIFLESLLRREVWNHFQMEKIPKSLLFLDFLRVLIRFWGFWIIRIGKCKKFLPTFFFGVYGFPNYFEILNFVFSNIPRGISTFKVLPFLGLVFLEIQNSKNHINLLWKPPLLKV